MKKFLFAAFLALSSVVAQADTLTLLAADGQPVSATDRVYCQSKLCPALDTSVPGVTVQVEGAPGYDWFYVVVNSPDPVTGLPVSTTYRSTVASGFSETNVQLQAGTLNPVTGQWSAVPGEFITYSGSWAQTSACVRSGRGQHCITNYYLTSGSVVR